MKRITKKQARAFAKVIKAMEAAKETGLVFFGKQWDLVAFTKETAYYEREHDIISNRNTKGDNYLENLSETILFDCGADDYGRYMKNSDDPYKGEFQETPLWREYL